MGRNTINRLSCRSHVHNKVIEPSRSGTKAGTTFRKQKEGVKIEVGV